MAHYAKLDENNIVTDIIVIANKDCLDENGNECEEPGRRMCETLTGHAKWKKTSYNTRLGVHYDSNTGDPSEDQSKAYRINFAQINMRYDEELNGFVETEETSSKAVSRMVIHPKTGQWVYPRPSTPYPDLQHDVYPTNEYHAPWYWNDNTQVWEKIKITDKRELYHMRNGEML